MHACYSSSSLPTPAGLTYRGGRREWRPVTAKQCLASGDPLPTLPIRRQIRETESSPLLLSPAARESVKGSGHCGQMLHQMCVASNLTRERECQVTAERSLRGRPSGARDGYG